MDRIFYAMIQAEADNEKLGFIKWPIGQVKYACQFSNGLRYE
jgi:hypothetical protein